MGGIRHTPVGSFTKCKDAAYKKIVARLFGCGA